MNKSLILLVDGVFIACLFVGVYWIAKGAILMLSFENGNVTHNLSMVISAGFVFYAAMETYSNKEKVK